jgi:hypothetical protein
LIDWGNVGFKIREGTDITPARDLRTEESEMRGDGLFMHLDVRFFGSDTKHVQLLVMSNHTTL